MLPLKEPVAEARFRAGRRPEAEHQARARGPQAKAESRAGAAKARAAKGPGLWGRRASSAEGQGRPVVATVRPAAAGQCSDFGSRVVFSS